MTLTFRKARNIGLGILLLIIFIISVVSYFMMSQSVDKLELVVKVEESKLQKWNELLQMIQESRSTFYDFLLERNQLISPTLLLIDGTLIKIKDIKSITGDEEELTILEELLEGLSYFKQAVIVFQLELEEGYTRGASEREVSELSIKKANKITQLSNLAVSHITEKIRNHNKVVLDTIILYQKILAFFLISAIFSTIGIAFLISKALSMPIRVLVEATKNVAKGNLDKHVKVESDDEIGSLCNAFNHMIDKLKLSRQELIAVKNYTHNIITHMKDVLIVTDFSGNIQTVNKAALELLGYQENELIGQSISTIFKDNTSVDLVIKESIEKDFVDNREERFISKEEKEIIVLFSASLIQEEDCTTESIICVAKEITKLKRVEEELKKAKENAEHANQAKSDFLARMSHEIRTPMNGVLGMAELLLLMDLTEKQRHMVNTIHRSGDTLLNIINDILDFSKIEAGKLELESVNFDLRQIVEYTVELFAENARKKGLELICIISEKIPTVLIGDPGRICQVLSNLISNALKFTEKGDVIINISPSREKEDKIYLYFEVKDTGIGIAKKDQKRIFDSFTQMEGYSKRKHSGTGLGMTISKQLVEIMCGDIGFTSILHKGSTFWFVIPLKKQTDNSQNTQSLTINFPEKRVLISVANKKNHDFLYNQLRAWSLVPESAENDSQVLEKLYKAVVQHKPFDLVILDMKMPDMDGLKTARLIKTNSSISEVPLLLLTPLGSTFDDIILKEGISASLTKPIRYFSLYNCLKKLLGITDNEVYLEQRETQEEEPVTHQFSFCILLVEDNLVNLEVVSRMLEYCGCTVDIALNGKEAIEAYTHKKYDLILMDCQMPEMDGFEASKHIRALKNPHDSHIPIIALTAYALKGDKENVLMEEWMIT